MATPKKTIRKRSSAKGSREGKRFTIVAHNNDVQTWLEAQDNRSASIELLIRMFISATDKADSDIYDTLISAAGLNFFANPNVRDSGSSANEATASTTTSIEENTTEEQPADTDTENEPEEKPVKKRPIRKTTKSKVKKLNGVDFFDAK